jgi:hypothetical protein
MLQLGLCVERANTKVELSSTVDDRASWRISGRARVAPSPIKLCSYGERLRNTQWRLPYGYV